MLQVLLLLFMAMARANWQLSAPTLTLPTLSSLQVEFEPFVPQSSGETIAYEVAYRSIFNSHWELVDDIGSAGNSVRVAQVVSIRVDDSAVVNSGSFKLSLTRNGLIETDMEHVSAHTTDIPWNADAATFKEALSALSIVDVYEVKRCDEFDHGGYDSWYFGCPYGDRGGYRWLVVFEVPKNGQFLPVLHQYRNELTASTWTGEGSQVYVFQLKSGMVSPSLCTDSKCRYNITNLDSGTLYSVKIRALTSTSAWSEYTRASEFYPTVKKVAPARPKPPTLSSVSIHKIALSLETPPQEYNVYRIESQYRHVYDDKSDVWTDGPYINLLTASQKHDYVMELSDLMPKSSYQFRVKYLNDVGYSAYSNPSTTYTTLVDEYAVITPKAPLIRSSVDNIGSLLASDDLSALNDFESAVGATWADVTALSISSDDSVTGKQVYRLEYKQSSEKSWHQTADPIVFTPRSEGVEVQEISSRSDDFGENGVCVGNFWLKLGNPEYTNIYEYVTPPIAFDASSDEVRQALYQIGKIKRENPTIYVRRRANSYNGYTWTVEIHGTTSSSLTTSSYSLTTSSYTSSLLTC